MKSIKANYDEELDSNKRSYIEEEPSIISSVVSSIVSSKSLLY